MIERADRPARDGDEGVLEGTVREVAALEAKERGRERTQDLIADRVTAITGNMTFVAINIAWVAAWILLNRSDTPTQFDPFPFALLAVIIPFEAMILAVFVLMSANAQGRRAERRARIEMQVNVLAEREVSKLVGLVAEIHEHLGLRGHVGEEVREMQGTTRLEHVANAVEAQEAKLEEVRKPTADPNAQTAD